MFINLTVLIIAVLWLLALTAVLFWFIFNLGKIIKDSEGATLVKILDRIYKREEENSGDIKGLAANLKKIEESDLSHLQRIGLVRFNPFNETGGDQSFSLALLDGKNNGLVLTGLHTRERTRLYLKPVRDLKSDYELSKEEKKALEKAAKIK